MVQPIFPEPIQVTRSVSQCPYDVRLAFVKKVLVSFCLVHLPLVLAASQAKPFIEAPTALVFFGVAILALTLSRRLFVRGPVESACSLFGLITVLILEFDLASSAQVHGVPVVLAASLSVVMLFYTLTCGRDFSFVGFVVVSMLAQTILAIVLDFFGMVPNLMMAPALLASLAMVSFISFDLAMIMKRRRPDEPVSSVADFYRDLLNFLTYPARVYDHWRKYRFDPRHG